MSWLAIFTIERDTQEESVGDVNHSAAQQTEDVHMSQAFQVVQVGLCRGHANVHRLL